ncbi:MAG: PAS domain S-box protein [Ferruginibacter sp.]|nr:PAS domain S-box protein [Ferruginibacter sp.]
MSAKKSVISHIEKLKQLTSDNITQQARIDSLKDAVEKRIAFSEKLISIRNEKGLDAANQLMATQLGNSHSASIRQLADAIEKEENGLLHLRQKENSESIASFNHAFMVFLACVFLLLLIILFSIRNYIAIGKKSEKQLKEFEYFFNNSNDFSCIANKQGYFEIVNSSFNKVLGYSQNELSTKPFLDFVHPDDIPATLEAYNQLKEGASLIHFINRYRKKDGDYLLFDWNATPNPHTDKLYCIARDITDRKKAEDALSQLNAELEQRVKERTAEIEKNENRFRAIIENNFDIITLIDKDFNVFYRSPSAVRIMGWTNEELIGKNGILNIHPADREKTKAIIQEIMSSPGKSVNVLFRNMHKNGYYLWVEGSIINLLHDENIKAFVFNCRDITARVEAEEKLIASEERFRAIIEQYPSPVIRYAPDGSHISANPAWETMWQDKLENTIDYNILKDPQMEISGMSKIIKQAFAGETVMTDVYQYDPSLIGKTGRKRWIQLLMYPLKDNDGKILEVILITLDMTANKEAEEKLIVSEKQYRYLFQNNPMPMWVIDLKTFKFLDVNEMAILQYGYSRQEFLSMTAMDIRPEEDASLFLQSDHTYLTNDKNYNKGIWRHRKKDGTIIEVEIIAHEILFEGAEARFVLANDVTEQKKAEEKIIASEKQFRNTLDNMLEGAQIIGFDWRYIYINDSLAKHAKFRREEMIGFTVMEKFPGIEQTEIYKVYQRCFNERVSIHLENKFTFPDGSVGWFELSFQPIPAGIFILSIDITERKKAEAAILRAEANYREIFEKASDAIYVLEIETGQILEINQRATEITGYSKEELIKRDPDLLMAGDPAYTAVQSQAYLQKAANGEPQQFEWLIKKGDGTHSWLEVNLTKAKIAGEDRILSFFREINDRKKAQQEVQKLNEELEQKVINRTEQLRKTNEELEAFSYSVSHDLRAPLRAIIGFSAILQEDYITKLDDEAKRITDVIIGNTKKMGQLIDDLLTFSRMGRQEVLKTSINTHKMVKETVEEIDRKENNAKKAEWLIHNLPPVMGDINIMRQVWVNLISNAVKYSAKKNVQHIEIGYFMQNTEIVFFVKDNGVGFDEKYKDKLFKVFQRLHSADEFDGTGIGLAIVEKIISKHGGKVWAEGEKDIGACFYFSLPHGGTDLPAV